MSTPQTKTPINTQSVSSPHPTTTSLFDVLDAVSHDLKSPVASIGSVLSLMKMKKEKLTPTELEKYIDRAELKVHFLNENIDALFATGALLENNFELQNVPIPLEELFKKIGYSVKNIELPTAQILQTIADEKWSVVGDPEWLSKAVITILQHAQRFSALASEKNSDEDSPSSQPIQIAVKKLEKKLAIEIRYIGKSIFETGTGDTAEPMRTKKSPHENFFELANFLPLITKELRLSLYVALMIIQKLGGEVQPESTVDSQQKLIVRLPAVS